MMKKNIIFDVEGVLFELDQGVGVNDKLFSPIPAGIALLHDVAALAAQEGHSLYICTNYSAQYMLILESEYPEIIGYFDGIVTTTKAQVKKPNPQIFRYLLDTYTLEPEASVFIDDQVTNVMAACKIGIEAIHAHDFEYVRRELVRIGVCIA